MHLSFETPASPHSGLSGAFTFYASESEWSLRSPVTRQWLVVYPAHTVPHTHGSPFVKQLINVTHGLKDTVGSHEVKTFTGFLSGHQISCKGYLMQNECRSIFIEDVVSLIMTSGQIDIETQHWDNLSTEVLIAQVIAELNLFQLIQLIHFDDCIQCDLTINELIPLIKGRRTLTQFTCANRRSKSSWNRKRKTLLFRCTFHIVQ